MNPMHTGWAKKVSSCRPTLVDISAQHKILCSKINKLEAEVYIHRNSQTIVPMQINMYFIYIVKYSMTDAQLIMTFKLTGYLKSPRDIKT